MHNFVSKQYKTLGLLLSAILITCPTYASSIVRQGAARASSAVGAARVEVGVVENLTDGDAYVGNRKLEIGSPVYLGDKISIKSDTSKRSFLLLRLKNSTLQLRGDGMLEMEKEILRAERDVWTFAKDLLEVVFRTFQPPKPDVSDLDTGIIGVRG